MDWHVNPEDHGELVAPDGTIDYWWKLVDKMNHDHKLALLMQRVADLRNDNIGMWTPLGPLLAEYDELRKQEHDPQAHR